MFYEILSEERDDRKQRYRIFVIDCGSGSGSGSGSLRAARERRAGFKLLGKV